MDLDEGGSQTACFYYAIYKYLLIRRETVYLYQ